MVQILAETNRVLIILVECGELRLFKADWRCWPSRSQYSQPTPRLRAKVVGNSTANDVHSHRKHNGSSLPVS